jgi:hypothetical protein
MRRADEKLAEYGSFGLELNVIRQMLEVAAPALPEKRTAGFDTARPRLENGEDLPSEPAAMRMETDLEPISRSRKRNEDSHALAERQSGAACDQFLDSELGCFFHWKMMIPAGQQSDK